MTRKNQNQTLQTNPRQGEEEPQNTNNYKTQEDIQSKATSSLFPIKMIAKLEGYQNKDQTQNPPKQLEQ